MCMQLCGGMTYQAACCLSALLLLASACGDDRRAIDGDGGPPRDAALPDGGDVDAARVDAGGGGGDAGLVCMPSAGTMMIRGSCQDVNIAVIARTGQPDEVQITGRVGFIGAATCARFDSLELTEFDMPVQRFELGGRSLSLEGTHVLASGPALPALSTPCRGDDARFYPYGVVIRGTIDGGSFEARCGPASSGMQFPPEVIRTCHRNIDVAPTDGNLYIDAFTGYAAAGYATFEHPAGTLIASVDEGIRVIAVNDSASPPAPLPFDATGWMTSVNEMPAGGGSYTHVALQNTSDVLGVALCPVDGPGRPGGAAILARITGTTSSGATFSSEVYSRMCRRPAPPPPPP